ncbi:MULTISPECIES: MarR family transcriptional regulator [Haloarcula]|uniref:MarR family transcriptional regulator n=1 Tax=Haloarcula TaxID=2237 RepID=UPI0023E8E811|nr:MarR family transcriptional regulator [Halomicroarcula sp. SHR3]
MPISADRFEDIEDGAPDPKPGTNAEAILSFLAAHADQAFTQSEIADATDVATGSVGPTLVRLRERGRVDHRGTYWRVSDHVESVEQTVSHASGVAASHEAEQFDYEGWQAHAVDPREERSGE